VSRQHLAGTFKRCADDFADIVRRRVEFDRAGFEPCHIEQVGNEAVEALRLLDDRRKQIDFAFVIQFAREAPTCPRSTENGCKWGFQIVGDGRQEC